MKTHLEKVMDSEISDSAVSESGLYLHIPYCKSKCLYCDFFSGGSRIADWPRLVDALLAEWDERRDELTVPPETIYVGGGTPSLMPAESFKRLIVGLGAGNPVEFTIEVNPDDVTDDKVELWRDCKVNRVSLGVQTLNDSLLRSIGRRHDCATALRSLRKLRSAFDNVSVDIMFGLPGQTKRNLIDTIAGIIDMNPDHISAYSLMYEPDTAMTQLRNTGRLHAVSDVDTIEMFETLSEMLRRAGYCQYEISNYAQPGYESRHNSGYWSGMTYLGLGPSAHSYDGKRRRRANPPALKQYLDRFEVCNDTDANRQKPFYIEEHLSDDELREEYIMLRLRKREGINISDFVKRFGFKQAEQLVRKIQKWLKSGHLNFCEDSISLTHAGIMQSDTIIVDLI